MTAPLAIVVNPLAVGEFRPAETVHGRGRAEGQVMDDGPGQVVDIHRAAGQVDDGFPGEQFTNRPGPGRIGVGRGQSAVSGTVADRDHHTGVAADLFENLHGRVPADGTVGSFGAGRDRPFDDADILSPVFFECGLFAGFGLMSGRRHDGFMIVQGDVIQNQFPDPGTVGAEQRFGVAGAILKFEPDHRRSRVILDGCSDSGGESPRNGKHRSDSRTIFQKIPARHPVRFEKLLELAHC